MRILFINQNRLGGGGATIAAVRLAEGLRNQGHEVTWLVKELGQGSQIPSDTQVLEPALMDRALARITHGRLTISPLRRSTYRWRNIQIFQNADVIHWHNLHPDYVNYMALPSLSRSKPTVWTWHDMWPMTGHCGFSLDCSRWRNGCGECPYMDVYPAIAQDWTSTEWRLKQRALQKIKVQLHTPSAWLTNCANAGIAKSHPVATLPYGLDMDRYSPGDAIEARRRLGLSPERITLLLASASLNDPRKPQSILCEAINQATRKQPERWQVLTFGKGDLRPFLDQGLAQTHLGLISDDETKRLAFRASNAFLFASHGDNLPLIIQESLACGTPVIASNVGGVSEMVIPSKTGWLVEKNSPEPFAAVLGQLADSVAMAESLRSSARTFATQHFDLVQHTGKMLELYQQTQRRFHGQH